MPCQAEIREGANRAVQMPSLFRFLFVMALLVGIVYGSMLALTIFVEPNPREMSVRIPAERVNP